MDVKEYLATSYFYQLMGINELMKYSSVINNTEELMYAPTYNESNEIDYDKIEQGFGRQIAKANNQKAHKSYVVLDGQLVEIVNKGSITMKNFSDSRNNSFKRQNLS